MDRMSQLPENSVGGIICDPPYGLTFMGKSWDKLDYQYRGGFTSPGIGDRKTAWPSFSANTPFGNTNPTCATCKGRLRGSRKCSCSKPDWRIKGAPPEVSRISQIGAGQQAWHHQWLEQAFRILQPGGILKAFGGSRTYHRLAAAMEQVGFEEVGLEAWGYGSGFPKSHDISKALDKIAGVTFEARPAEGVGFMNAEGRNGYNVTKNRLVRVGEGSEESQSWDGWGTALKPAWEPAVIGRKPL